MLELLEHTSMLFNPSMNYSSIGLLSNIKYDMMRAKLRKDTHGWSGAKEQNLSTAICRK